MKASRPSGENAAPVALLMFSGVVDDGAELTTYTWLGVEIVSEKMAMWPLCETARTLPVTRPMGVPGASRGENGLELPPTLPGLMARAPNSLPAKAASPAGSNTRELGGVGISAAAPGRLVVVVTL